MVHQNPPQYDSAPHTYGTTPLDEDPIPSAPPSDAPPQYGNFPPQYAYTDDRIPLNRHGREEQFQPTGYRDVFFVILFILHLVGLGVVLAVGVVKRKNSSDVPNEDENTFIITPADYNTLKTYIGICAICATVGGVLSFLYLAIIKRFARQVIIATLVISIVLAAATAAFFMFQKQYAIGVFLLIIVLLNAFIFYAWRDRIPFASLLLSHVATIIHEYPGTAYTAYLSLVVQLIFVIVWAIAVTLAQSFEQQVFAGLATFLLLSFYWTVQVIKNTVHVTVSGTVATYYFMKNAMPSNPTLKAFKRATTTSFGSICLGSLLVATLQTIRALVQMARNGRHQLLVLFVDCILGCLESLIRYFNKYAFTQVAIYGKTYVQAARDTWELFKSHGIQAIINDNLISSVLSIGSLLGGIICGILGGLLGYWWIPAYWASASVAGFLIGFSMLILTMEVVDSGVSTIFVSLAMDPQALQRNDPILYQQFHDRYHNLPLWTM